MRILLFIFLVLTRSLAVVADEEELVEVHLPPSCVIVQGCQRCEDDAIKECHDTGFVQKYKCEEKRVEDASKMDIFRYESCIPPVEDWVAMVRFDVAMLLGAVASMMYVRLRKQLAKNNLVNLVNRS